MLCPEVWNFKAPESTFSSKIYSPNENSHLNIVDDFFYNHLVSVILPDTNKVPENLTQAFGKDCDFYKLNNVKLSEFVAKDFINNFVNSGSLYVLSLGTRLDCDNSASVTPTGQLILNLTKSTYQSLGLEGSVSHFHAVTAGRYIVNVDLKGKHFKPGKPNYEKAKKCLEALSCDVIVTWEPQNEEICPSSVAKYFCDLGYSVRLCEIQNKSHTVYSVKVPTLQDDQHYEFAEWLGMVALEGNMVGFPDDYISTYEVPEPNKEVGQVKFVQWRGFFTADKIKMFLKHLNEFRRSRKLEWAAVYVQGFSDSPVAWRGEEHHFYTNGDNSYTLILTDDNVISCVQKCTQKRYSNKMKGKPL